MDANPPQGDTYSCWAAAVVCAAHDLGNDVARYRSAEGVAELVAAYDKTTTLAANGKAGINHVVGLARLLGVEARDLAGPDAAEVKALLADGNRVIVNWNPSKVRRGWYAGQHMGAILGWADEVTVSDSCADDNGSRAELRAFTAPRARWFRPTVAVLSRPVSARG